MSVVIVDNDVEKPTSLLRHLTAILNGSAAAVTFLMSGLYHVVFLFFNAEKLTIKSSIERFAMLTFTDLELIIFSKGIC